MKLAKLTAVLCAAVLTFSGVTASAAAPLPYTLRTARSIMPFDAADDTEETMIIGGYEGEVPANLVIPQIYEGKKVIGIEACVFQGNRNIITLSLPGTLFSIGDEAFKSCRRMESLTLENGESGHDPAIRRGNRRLCIPRMQCDADARDPGRQTAQNQYMCF